MKHTVILPTSSGGQRLVNLPFVQQVYIDSAQRHIQDYVPSESEERTPDICREVNGKLLERALLEAAKAYKPSGLYAPKKSERYQGNLYKHFAHHIRIDENGMLALQGPLRHQTPAVYYHDLGKFLERLIREMSDDKLSSGQKKRYGVVIKAVGRVLLPDNATPSIREIQVKLTALTRTACYFRGVALTTRLLQAQWRMLRLDASALYQAIIASVEPCEERCWRVHDADTIRQSHALRTYHTIDRLFRSSSRDGGGMEVWAALNSFVTRRLQDGCFLSSSQAIHEVLEPRLALAFIDKRSDAYSSRAAIEHEIKTLFPHSDEKRLRRAEAQGQARPRARVG